MVEYDAIVVGGGHNGLVAGAYLAKHGFKTLILERRPILGGASVTEEIIPGFKVSSLAYTVGLFQKKVIDELELRKFGYKAYPYEIQYILPFPDGKYLMAWRDDEKTIKEIEKFSKKDAESYRKFSKLLASLAGLVEHLIDGPPPTLEQLVSILDDPDLIDTFKLLFYRSGWDILDEFFESEEVKCWFATQAVIGAFASPSIPGTGYVMMHHFLTEVEGEIGVWGWIKGGMGELSNVIARAAGSYGAEIKTDSEVKEIIVKDGEAKGVVLSDGTKIGSKIIVSNVDPVTTLLKLVGEDYLDKGVVRRLKRVKMESATAKINLALDGLPKLKHYPEKIDGMIDILPSREYIERAYDDAKYGMPSKEPFMEMVFPTVTDDTLAPSGKHVLSIFLQYAPYKLKQGRWEEEAREELFNNAIEVLSGYFPDIKKMIIGKMIITPEDMERIYGLPHGSIFHIDMSPDQLGPFRPIPGYSDYTTPIKNLYLCGAGTHPGGGVMGINGRNCALKIIEERKIFSKFIRSIKDRLKYSKLAAEVVKRSLKEVI